MKPISEYTSVGEWKTDVEKEGYHPGTQVCWALDKTMRKYNMTFPQAYAHLFQTKKLSVEGSNFIVDLSATQPD